MLFIATPVYDGTVSHHYLRGALETCKRFPDTQFSVATGTNISQNRERLTDQFLESKCDHLLFIDSDIGWTVTDIELLLAVNVKIVSGTYIRKIDRTLAAEVLVDGTQTIYPELLECAWVPAGFLLIQRSGIEEMKRRLEDTSLWAYQYHGRQFIGEDVAFSFRWKALGGQLWLHSGVIVKHIGEAVYLPDDFGYPHSTMEETEVRLDDNG